MSDDALIRLENLKRLKKTPVELSKEVGNRYTYWRDLLAGKKSFGEKIARKIEEGLGLARGYLDICHAGEDKDAEASWPFPLVPPSDYALISLEYRQRIENELVGEVQRRKRAAARAVEKTEAKPGNPKAWAVPKKLADAPPLVHPVKGGGAGKSQKSVIDPSRRH